MAQERDRGDIESLVFKPSKSSWSLQTTLTSMSPRFERLTLTFILVAVAALIAWSYLSFKAVVVEGSGEVTPVSAPLPLLAKSAFTVKEILVKDFQAVAKGDPLIYSTRFLKPDQFSRQSEYISSLTKLSQMGECDSLCMVSFRQLSESCNESLTVIEPNTEYYGNLVEVCKDLKDHVTQLSIKADLPMTLSSFRNEMTQTENKINEIKRRRAEKILAMEFEELQSKLASIKTQIKEREINTRTQIETSTNLLATVISKLPQALQKYQENAAYLSPSEGRVRFANLKGVGQLVGGGEVLMYVSQSSSQLWLKFIISEADVSKLKIGQDVRIDLSSYPASEYGIQQGKVAEVLDRFPIENGDQKTTAFTVYANLEKPSVVFKQRSYPLRSGMQAQVKVIVRHERLSTLMIRKLFSLKEEYFGDIQ